ncbi:MAG TPA: tRNA pseudouridine(38-40) synthase TruA [Blastocatellia bacterium]|nr:tRNA pseudouridine(38-40) synthase TruA [Blastocatellia bacterium]
MNKAKTKYRQATSDKRSSATSHQPTARLVTPQCWKLMLEYDGTKYHGWQEQTNARTIQGELRKAAEDLFGERVELGGAGRTDAGVHALAQVAHLKLRQKSRLRPQEILFGLNDRLPADICLLEVTETHPHFHARHDATARSYVYQISTRKTAFAKKQVWWVKDKLDVAAMAECAKLLIGRHDFQAFSKPDPARPDESTIVVVTAAEVTTDEHLILFRITASHFLWNMVRRIVGALVEVGRHHLTGTEFAAQLHHEVSESTVWTAPPAGLFLERIHYPVSR